MRWVGKTVETLERRISKHLRHGSNNYNPAKQAWLDELRAVGSKPLGVVLQTGVPEYSRVMWEQYWIDVFKEAGAPLLNVKRPD